MIKLTFLNAKHLMMLLFGAFMVCQPAHAIKKCQDDDGKWYYGDVAVTACENSKIVTLNDSGSIAEETEAPKSEAQLRAEAEQDAQAEAELERSRLEEQERYRITSVYETVTDIDRQRDNQIYSVQSNIDVHNAYLKNMAARIEHEKGKLSEATHPKAKERINKSIASSEAGIKSYTEQLNLLLKQKLDIVEKFKQEKELYIKLTENK